MSIDKALLLPKFKQFHVQYPDCFNSQPFESFLGLTQAFSPEGKPVELLQLQLACLNSHVYKEWMFTLE